MRIHDIVLGPIILLCGVGLCIWSLYLSSPSNVAFGPGLFPSLMGGGLALSGLFIGLSALSDRSKRALFNRPEWLVSYRTAVKFWVIPASIFFYVLVSGSLGFLATAIVILFVSMVTRKITWPHALVTAVSVAVVINLIFASILHVPLPWGPLAPISGWFIW